MEIDLNTRFITLVGDPLAQSFAARMQNAAFRAAGVNMRYFYTQAGTERLGDIVAGIRAMPSFAGAAFTKPNKVAVLEFLDELDPFCRKMGSCNTAVKRDGRLVGYNTDGAGFCASLKAEAGVDVQGLDFFCIGAGGAGRAICFMLAHRGARRVFITDCIEDRARRLAKDIDAAFAADARFIPYEGSACAEGRNDARQLHDSIASCDVVVNASGVGMGATIGQSPVPAHVFRIGQLAFDACYNPAETRFLADARAAGCRTLNGLGMSLYQGAAQMELWTGKPAPVDAMRAELLAILAEAATESDGAPAPGAGTAGAGAAGTSGATDEEGNRG